MKFNFQFLSVALFLLFSPASAANVNVVIQNGPIIGETIILPGHDNHQLQRFLGIPYAQPPLGPLRFRKPVPLENHKWTKPLEALNWPNSCVQFRQISFTHKHPDQLLNHNNSEDCLYLNVWSPNVEVESEEQLRPVIVWIHGGGLIMGTSSFDLFDGEMLASRTDSVVVTFNYRLSTLGFLYSDEVEGVSGNQGLWDQALALEWVQENIRYFGGDPSAVTIMGESAGAWSVSAHILSPVSKNLFQSAILMSGAAINEKFYSKPANFVKSFLTGIRKVGCATEEDLTINKKVVECLQNLEAEKVDMIVYMIHKDLNDLQPLILIDGEFLPAEPLNLLENGDFKTDVKLLVSTVEDEGSFLLALTQPQFRAESPEPLTLDQAKHFLIDQVSNHYLYQPVPEQLITKFYYRGLNDKLDSQNKFRKRTGIAYGDLMLSCPTLEFAKQVFAFSRARASVYQWYYSAKLGSNKILGNSWAGTSHCDDLYPAFGMAFRHPVEYLARERDISNEVLDIFKSFIREGNPGPGQSEWEPFFMTDDGQDVIAPYYEIGNEHKKPESFKFNLKQLECNLIWNRYNYVDLK